VATSDPKKIIEGLVTRIVDCRARSTIDYETVNKLRQELVDAASTMFGSESPEASDANIVILTEAQLSNLENHPELPRPVTVNEEIPTIFERPRVSRSEYYRKRLDELNEMIIAFSICLRGRSGA
jgi:hypothetical protein